MIIIIVTTTTVIVVQGILPCIFHYQTQTRKTIPSSESQNATVLLSQIEFIKSTLM